MSKLLVLYANNADENVPGTYTTQLNTSYLSNVRAVAIKSATFVNNLPNIFTSGDRQNNEFLYTIDGSPFTATVAIEGYYTVQQTIDLLVTAIQTQLDISSPGDTVSAQIEDYSGKVSFTVTGVAVMTYTGSTGLLNQLLGNTEDSGNVAASTKYIFNKLPNMIGLKSATISIKSKTPKTILNQSSTKAIWTNSLTLIPVDVGYGQLQGYINPDLIASRLVFDIPEDLTYLQFKIRGDDGKTLLGQTEHLAIELKVWTELV